MENTDFIEMKVKDNIKIEGKQLRIIKLNLLENSWNSDDSNSQGILIINP